MDSGVYAIINNYNGRKYIGSSKSLTHRKTQNKNRLKEGKHHNEELQKDWKIYGEGWFSIVTLKLCENYREEERVYIKNTQNIYNLSTPDDNIGTVSHAESTKVKCGLTTKQDWELNREKRLEAIKKGIETRKNNGKDNYKHLRTKIIAIGEEVCIHFESIQEAADFLKIQRNKIQDCLTRTSDFNGIKGRASYKGFQFIYNNIKRTGS